VLTQRRILIFAVCLLAPHLGAQSSGTNEKVLIRAARPYTALVNAIHSRGGTVTHQFRHVDAIAAEIPRNSLEAISALVPAGAIGKDLIVPNPAPIDTMRGRSTPARTGDEDQIVYDSVQPLSANDVSALASSPNGYRLNNAIANVSGLHWMGKMGQGVVVAVIDSGIRPGFPHISSDGSVIGCEDFVGDALGCSHFSNSGHGTFVAGMISANANFTFSTASALRNAVLAECPACFANPPTNTMIPMVGTAPLSSIYAMRVFGPTGGAPTSRILAAIERVIELSQRFNAGMPGGVDIEVVNLSLGGPTLFSGQDVFDLAVDQLLVNNIVPVISAGNAGPATLTTGSPGSAVNALTVGAASLPHNERILRRVQFGPVVGSLYRPFLGTQTAFFSSRGPHADGRPDPDITSNGFACYGQGFSASTAGISIASGTSFSAPSVAGVAALLRQSFPLAPASKIRNALILTANPGLIADGSNTLDQGAGYVNGQAAYNLLLSSSAPSSFPSLGNPNKNVKVNIEKGTSLNVRDGLVQQPLMNLQPGQRYDILYRVHPNTSQVIIILNNVTPALPPPQQNQLFGDDILLAVHSAKTSSIGEGDYPVFAFTLGGTFVINNPERGIMRVSVNGDWTNAGAISANVLVFSTTDPIPQLTNQGKISQGQSIVVPITVPSGASSAEFRLGWLEDWGNYPTNDLDLILISPGGAANFNGATLNNPENVAISNPAAGTWTALIQGFEVNNNSDKFEFRAAIDGKVVK